MNANRISIFCAKLKNRILQERKRIWENCDVDNLSMRGYRAFDGVESLSKQLRGMLGGYDLSILVGISDVDKGIIIDTANQAMRHEFDLLGSGPVVLDPIDWHIDFKSGKRWEKKFFREITSIKGADIKVPWELSRCQHLLWLGEAYLLTGEDKYAKEVVDEINWWIDDNPIMYSVNWKCAMDVAFRAVNWIHALNMITVYSGFDETFTTKVGKSLWQHGFFIYNNLEKSIPDSNNHYTSDLAGLLYLGVLFEKTSKGKAWKRFAIKEFFSEIRKQVLDSGVQYERSVSYHRMVTEMLSYPIYMLQRIGETVPADITNRIKKMYEYVATYTKPNQYAPMVGDNDDGRFLPFLKRDFRKHSYLNDPVCIENRFVALGRLPIFYSKSQRSKVYSDAGLAVIREGNEYLFINNGGYSKRPDENQNRIGTHTHNDLLSFELSINGEDIIVDPGTYLYTSSQEDRDRFRSTAKHNTVVVDGEEQNGFVLPFYVKRNVNIGVLQKWNGGYEGEYTTIAGQLTHHRRFILKEGGVEIIDNLTKEGEDHKALLLFHFAENIQASVKGNSVDVCANNKEFRIVFSTKPLNVEIKKDTISPSYGVLKESLTAIATFDFTDKLEILTTIEIN